MSPWIPVIGTLGGAFITSLINYFNNRTNKRSEERKHANSLLFNAAIENWKKGYEYAHEHALQGLAARAKPIDAYLFHMFKLSKILFDENLSSDEIVKEIEKSAEFFQTMDDTYNKLSDKS